MGQKLRYRCEFDVRLLGRDLEQRYRIPLAQIPELYEQRFGQRIHRTTVYSWFRLHQLTLQRFMELSSIVYGKTGEPLDFNTYMVEIAPPLSRKPH